MTVNCLRNIVPYGREGGTVHVKGQKNDDKNTIVCLHLNTALFRKVYRNILSLCCERYSSADNSYFAQIWYTFLNKAVFKCKHIIVFLSSVS